MTIPKPAIEAAAQAIWDAPNGIDGDPIGGMIHESDLISYSDDGNGIASAQAVCRVAAQAALSAALPHLESNSLLRRMADFFDRDDTASSFMSEDGDGGYVGCVHRMAREIDRLRSSAPSGKAEAVEPWGWWNDSYGIARDRKVIEARSFAEWTPLYVHPPQDLAQLHAAFEEGAESMYDSLARGEHCADEPDSDDRHCGDEPSGGCACMCGFPKEYPSSADVAALIQEAIDLLRENIYGNPARSPGHNAQHTLKAALSALQTAPKASAEGVAAGLEMAAEWHESEIAGLDRQIAENDEYARRVGRPGGAACPSNRFCEESKSRHRVSAQAIRSLAPTAPSPTPSDEGEVARLRERYKDLIEVLHEQWHDLRHEEASDPDRPAHPERISGWNAALDLIEPYIRALRTSTATGEAK